MEPSNLIVFCGPSGVGKGTIISMLKSEYPEKIEHSISHTTRAPRSNEINGIHYHFISAETFTVMINNGEFLEYTTIHNNMYGTTYSAIDAFNKLGKTCILDLDIVGCKNIKNLGYAASLVFIQPPSLDILKNRLIDRGAETSEQIDGRIKTAKIELVEKNDVNWDLIVINDNLITCYNEIKHNFFH